MSETFEEELDRAIEQHDRRDGHDPQCGVDPSVGEECERCFTHHVLLEAKKRLAQANRVVELSTSAIKSADAEIKRLTENDNALKATRAENERLRKALREVLWRLAKARYRADGTPEERGMVVKEIEEAVKLAQVAIEGEAGEG